MRPWLFLALAACGSSQSRTVDNKGSGAPPPPTTGAPVPAAVRKAVCEAEPCGGELSSIQVFRDASGAVKRLYRTFGPCSHNPGIYFDPFGTQTEVIPEKPVSDPAELAQLKAVHDEQTRGLTKAESLGCR